jgi:hypothetical protein
VATCPGRSFVIESSEEWHHQSADREGLRSLCRLHLYGDIYSSPGLDLRQKQLLACAFLGVANMPDQLFGHAVAVSLPPS